MAIEEAKSVDPTIGPMHAITRVQRLPANVKVGDTTDSRPTRRPTSALAPTADVRHARPIACSQSVADAERSSARAWAICLPRVIWNISTPLPGSPKRFKLTPEYLPGFRHDVREVRGLAGQIPCERSSRCGSAGMASLDGCQSHTGVDGSLTGRYRPLSSMPAGTTNSNGAEHPQSVSVAHASALAAPRL